MARQRLTYRERDLAAALKILRRDGTRWGRIRIDKNGVTIEPANDAAEAEKDADEAERARLSQIIRDL